MSRNIIHTIGQHVFKYLPPVFTEQGAPFLARNPERKSGLAVKDTKEAEKFQFLGEGYYFWDDNIERDSKMLLNPEIIICFYDKNELNLQDRRYIDKNNESWHPGI